MKFDGLWYCGTAHNWLSGIQLIIISIYELLVVFVYIDNDIQKEGLEC